MEEKTREQQAADVLKTMKLFIRDFVNTNVKTETVTAASDQAKQRAVAAKYATYQALTDAKDWEPGMTTEPGDIVYDPDHNYKYIYTGQDTYKHTNPLFYPGAAGVYHWAVIPKIKDFIKVYPDVQGIIVAVKQGESWWNQSMTQVFKWKGVDNANCVWPPVEGNEWELVTSVTD